MCGIAGLYRVDLTEDRQRLCMLEMTSGLRHRGPDGDDIYTGKGIALGHCRLSIIAPTSDSNQPMRRGSLIIVYNGELYNYREEKQRLQSKGVRFKTQSDTEVVLALYEDEGVFSFSRLNGIFSFAIYNEETGHLVCARDHMGVKPFLYKTIDEGILFASELKSILSSDLVERKIDRAAVALLLKKGSIPQPYTMVEGVRSLMPGHYMICKGEQVEVVPYYTLKKKITNIRKDDDWQAAIHENIRRSVKEQLVADVPVGAFLSGGVDSGLIVALMREMSSKVKTYSVGFEHGNTSEQHDETNEAKHVANFLDTEHQNFIISDLDAKNELISIIKSLDHPTIDGINSYFVSKVASEHTRVALSGTGADEILGGYAWFDNMRNFDNFSLLEKIKFKIKGHGDLEYYNSLHSCFSDKSIKNLLGSDYNSINNFPRTNFSDNKDVARTSEFVMSTFLQNQLLPDIDTASMAHGLEVRVPYLNKDLVELCLATPDHLKLGIGDMSAPEGSYAREGTKKVLIEIARQYLPVGFDLHPKRGFSMPMARWLKTIWKDEVEDTLSYESIKNRGLFDPSILTHLRSHNMPWTQTWLLMAIELWCRNVLDGGVKR